MWNFEALFFLKRNKNILNIFFKKPNKTCMFKSLVNAKGPVSFAICWYDIKLPYSKNIMLSFKRSKYTILML